MEEESIFEKGLKGWKDKLDLIREAMEISCPVCGVFVCRQWGGYEPSIYAKECPLRDTPKLCQDMREALMSLNSLHSTINEIIYRIESEHQNSIHK